MKEILLNGYFRIEPITHKKFVEGGGDKYEEIGKIVGVPFYQKDIYNQYIGGICFFDSYIAKRYPVIGGKPDEYQWFVPFSEIVKIELDEGASFNGRTEVSKTSDGGSIPPAPANAS